MSSMLQLCSKCNNSFYLNNVICIGHAKLQNINCPYCNNILPIASSGVPKTSKIRLTQELPSKALLQAFNSSNKYKNFKNCVYHITSKKNLCSIMQEGLLPYFDLKAKGMNVETGGDDNSLNIDHCLGLDKYIHLSFTSWCPMFFRNKQKRGDLILLHIKLDVIDQPNVIFCDRIATARDAIFYNNLDFNFFDFEAVYGYSDWKTKEGQERRSKTEKYEILVPNHIPPDKIIGTTALE